MKEKVYNMLVNIPWTRERSRRMEGITKLLTAHRMWDETHHTSISLYDLTTFASNAATADRAWRDILEENEELRGSDYGEKDRLEEEKMEELGYSPTP